MFVGLFSNKLKKILKKLKKKDKKRFDMIREKTIEIVENPRHYKNLKYSMKEFSRAHIDSSFVLIFKINEKEKTVSFEDIQHHDKVYKQ